MGARASLSLFDRLVAECGLASLFAARSMRRVFERAGLRPEAITRNDLLRMLPEIEQVLRIYLQPDEITERLDIIRRLGD